MGNLFSENQKQTTFQLDDMGVKEETIVNGGTDNGFDLINRDPNSINSHVKVKSGNHIIILSFITSTIMVYFYKL